MATLELIKAVGYDMAYLYAYSLRDRTHAAHKLVDDVPPDVKARRLNEMINTWRADITVINQATEMEKTHLVLIEGDARRKVEGNTTLTGRTDTNKRVLFSNLSESSPGLIAGEYAEVKITGVTGHTLRGEALCRSSIHDWTLKR